MNKALLVSLAVVCLGAVAPAQTWSAQWMPDPVDGLGNPVLRWVRDFDSFVVQPGHIEQALQSAPRERFTGDNPTGVIVTLPVRGGRTERFRVWENTLLGDQVQNQIPWFRTFSGQGIDSPASILRAEVGNGRLTAMVLDDTGSMYIEPLFNEGNQAYFVYRDVDSIERPDWRCDANAANPFQQFLPVSEAEPIERVSGSQLYTYRLAINTTVEYTAARGGIANAPAAVATSINRVDGIYRRDLAIGFNLVWVKNWEVEPDGLTNSSNSTALGENPGVLNNVATGPGIAAYDLGHVFTTAGGGVAYLASVGGANKAGAASGLSNPVGDAFDLIVSHEIGHQFDGYHAFNALGGNCAANRMWQGSFEPGSGASIMSYAGRCTGENTESDMRAYFNAGTISRMLSFRNTISTVAVISNVVNNLPTFTVGPNRTIPQGTPFKLSGVGADADGDAMTFIWEQIDLPASSSTVHAGPITSTTTNTSRPLFRSFLPSATGHTRFFPSSSLILANNYTNTHEFLPNVNRTMRMRGTVRDNRANAGGVRESDVVLTVSGAPFQMTSFGTAATLNTNQTHQVTWDVGGGSVAPTVNILMSTNSGTSYFNGTATMVAAGVPNTGTATVTLPAVTSSTARFFIEAVGNVFFDVNNATMTISTANRAPVITNPGAIAIDEEVAWSFNPVFSHPDNLQTLTWSLVGTVPFGLTVNSTTGQLNWAPTEAQGAGTYPLSLRATDNGTAPLSSTVNFSVNVNEVAKLVAGTVQLPGYVASLADQPVTVQMLPAVGSTPIETRNLTLNASGEFSYDSSAAPASVRFFFTRPFTLRKRVGPVALTGTGAALGSFALVIGDVDGSNEVDGADIDLVIAGFGGSAASADVDGSGEVDAADIDLVIANFGEVGDN